MTKYTLIAEHTDMYTGNTVSKSTHEFEVDGLMEVVENVELFLKGAGFVFDGFLDIVPTEEDDIDNQEWQTPEWNIPQEEFTGDGHDGMGSLYDEMDLPQGKSKHYFDIERNK